MPCIQKLRIRLLKSNKDKFRESVTLKLAEASFRQGWRETLAGDTKPVSELWEDIECMPETLGVRITKDTKEREKHERGSRLS
jgi:hypothetical protein